MDEDVEVPTGDLVRREQVESHLVQRPDLDLVVEHRVVLVDLFAVLLDYLLVRGGLLQPLDLLVEVGLLRGVDGDAPPLVVRQRLTRLRVELRVLAYDLQRGAYLKIFERCGLEVTVVTASSGAMGGRDCEEFMAFGLGRR